MGYRFPTQFARGLSLPAAEIVLFPPGDRALSWFLPFLPGGVLHRDATPSVPFIGYRSTNSSSELSVEPAIPITHLSGAKEGQGNLYCNSIKIHLASVRGMLHRFLTMGKPGKV